MDISEFILAYSQSNIWLTIRDNKPKNGGNKNMKKSQLNAISRSYTKNNLEELINKTEMLYNLFEFQKQYKSLTAFLKSDKIDFQAILETLETRKEELEKVGCTSYKYGYVLKCIEYTNTKIEEREGK